MLTHHHNWSYEKYGFDLVYPIICNVKIILCILYQNVLLYLARNVMFFLPVTFEIPQTNCNIVVEMHNQIIQ